MDYFTLFALRFVYNLCSVRLRLLMDEEAIQKLAIGAYRCPTELDFPGKWRMLQETKTYLFMDS